MDRFGLFWVSLSLLLGCIGQFRSPIGSFWVSLGLLLDRFGSVKVSWVVLVSSGLLLGHFRSLSDSLGLFLGCLACLCCFGSFLSV